MIAVAGIVKQSIVDGSGLRLAVFAQGCPHACPGCHNPDTHPFDGGYPTTTEDILKEIEKNPLLQGVTISGGEPFCQAQELLSLAESVKALGKNLWIYTGYTWEELIGMSAENPHILPLISFCDVLVDGRYLHNRRDLTLPFRGSDNQRIIDVAASLERERVITINM